MLRKMTIQRFQSTTSKGTFAFQSELPHLPVPTLEETAYKYLKSVKPLVSEESYKHTEQCVSDFLKPNSIGPVLQQRLINRSKTEKNWIYKWWNEDAYLKYRDPIVPYVSYFYSYKDQPSKFKSPNERAAAITMAALKFKDQLVNETLEVDTLRKQPIDMELFKFLFNTCRIPVDECDQCAMYPTSNEHIILIRRNRFYKVKTSNGSRKLTFAEIEHQFDQVRNDAELKGTAANVGILTSEHRDRWTDARKRLMKSKINQKSLHEIESASFVVCLDFAAPTSAVERTHQYWHGHGRNRFYDKPVQFIINDNKTAGFMGEHSMMDGTQTLRLNEFVLKELQNGVDKGTLEYESKVEELPFELDNVYEDIKLAEKHFKHEISQHEVAVWQFKQYGKNLIKRFKVSPDAFVQMLLQLAYYKMFGMLRPVYESATTRKFIQGRTETNRSVSIDSAALASKFWDPKVSDNDKIDLFRKAVKSQVEYIADASEGKGVDRHLFGLKKLLQNGEELPAIYKDKVYGYSSSWYISSSQLSSEYLNGYGWSQVIDEGFGCAYMINNNDININICSKYMGSHKFRDYLEETAIELARLLTTELPTSHL